MAILDHYFDFNCYRLQIMKNLFQFHFQTDHH